MVEMTMLAVGKPYPVPVGEMVGADFLRASGNRLLIALPGIDQAEARALKKGRMLVGMMADGGAILLLWRFCDERGRPVLTLDTPFDARVIPDLALHNIDNAEQRLAIELHAVDSRNNLVRALRLVTMPADFTRRFLSAVQDQLAAVGGGMLLDDWMQTPAQDLADEIEMVEMGA
jgi:hypothetical protein